MTLAEKETEENSLIKLLNSSNFTLKDVLLNEFIVQESRYGKSALVNYITKRENMIELLKLVIYPDYDESVPIKQQYRLSFIASELLTIRGNDLYQYAIVTDEESVGLITKFLNDPAPMNHLIGSFFAKLLECLLTKQFHLTFTILRNSNFLEKCLQNISFGAMGCLLENLPRIPRVEDHRTVQEWIVEQNLLNRIVDLIDVTSSDDDNECLSDVFCEWLKETRDRMYLDHTSQGDFLYEHFMNEEIIQKIVAKIVVPEDATNEQMVKQSGTIKAALKILDIYLVSNVIQRSPHQRINDEFFYEDCFEIRYMQYCELRKVDPEDTPDFDQYLFDCQRIVEGYVVNRSLNMLQTVMRDLQGPGMVWQPLLRLIVRLVDTNYLPTHETLMIVFQQLPFIKLFELAKSLPKCSFLHSIIQTIVAYILYTKFPDHDGLSPVAEYLLKDSGLIQSMHETAFTFMPSDDLVSASGLRTFNMQLADIIYLSQHRFENGRLILELLQMVEQWEELEESTRDYEVQRFYGLHHSLNKSSLTTNMNLNQSDDFLNNSEEWTDAATKLDMIEKEAGIKTAISAQKSEQFDSTFGAARFSDFETDTPDEDEFRKLCSQRASSCTPSSTSNTPVAPQPTNEWPGVSQTNEETSQLNGEAQVQQRIPIGLLLVARFSSSVWETTVSSSYDWNTIKHVVFVFSSHELDVQKMREYSKNSESFVKSIYSELLHWMSECAALQRKLPKLLESGLKKVEAICLSRDVNEVYDSLNAHLSLLKGIFREETRYVKSIEDLKIHRVTQIDDSVWMSFRDQCRAYIGSGTVPPSIHFTIPGAQFPRFEGSHPGKNRKESPENVVEPKNIFGSDMEWESDLEARIEMEKLRYQGWNITPRGAPPPLENSARLEVAEEKMNDDDQKLALALSKSMQTEYGAPAEVESTGKNALDGLDLLNNPELLQQIVESLTSDKKAVESSPK